MLISLEASNRILEETLSSIVTAERRSALELKICDFDSAVYWVRSIRASPDGPHDILLVSLAIPVFKQVESLGASNYLRETYGDLLVTPEDGSDVMLHMDLGQIPNGHQQDLVKVVSRLSQIIAGSPFKTYFSSLSKNNQTSLEPARFSQHQDCPVFIIPKHDRVVIVFSLNVKEHSDAVISTVFLTEFAEARRKVPAGPIVQFSSSPPKEIQDAFNIQDRIGNVGFISFAMLPSHVDTPAKIEAAAAIFSGFRTYIQYHIKCSKAYFHSRMRARQVSLLKVLNRAKNDQFEEGKEKKKKTFSGRTFEQKA